MAMHLPSARGRGRRAPMAEINVTPFVDVMLVLLIIFMITAQMLNSGVSIDLPESKAKALEQDKKPVQLSIDNAGRIYLDSQTVSDRDLPARLEAIAAQRDAEGKPPQIFLRGDQGIGYGKVMQVMGELNRAGLNRVSLVTSTEKGDQ